MIIFFSSFKITTFSVESLVKMVSSSSSSRVIFLLLSTFNVVFLVVIAIYGFKLSPVNVILSAIFHNFINTSEQISSISCILSLFPDIFRAIAPT
ncbi:hypothetical protein D3C81_1614530 [compost metagenome]